MNEGEELKTEKEIELLRWESPEYVGYARDWKWFVLAGTVLLVIVLYSAYVGDWFIVVLAPILASIFYWYLRKEPAISAFKATQLGIYLNDKFYPYSEIHSFWMFLKAEPKKLNIIFRKNYLPQLTVLFTDIDPVLVRSALAKYIPEQTDKTESFIEKLSRLLRI